MNMFKKNGGFTLVELIVVIAILAILAAVAVPAYSGYINKANDAADTTALAAVKTAALAANATKGETKAILVTLDKGVITKVVAVVKTGVDATKTPAVDVVEGVVLYVKDGTNNADYMMFMNGNSALEMKGTFKSATTLNWLAAKNTAEIAAIKDVSAAIAANTEAGWTAPAAKTE